MDVELKDPGIRPQICWYHKNGKCRFSGRCRFSHDLRSSQTSSSSTTKTFISSPSEEIKEKQKCSICYEYPPSLGRRFGLLSACDHVFCLDCIRQWRRADTQRKDVVRTCPICRQTSYFVVPANSHLTGEDKKKTFDRFKNSTSMIPCRYQSAGKLCPFGHRCFYLHLDDNGKDTKPKEKKEWERKQKIRSRACVDLAFDSQQL
mmetsp:Transcript_14485/g.22016  ORF Transcript_14485/g.22016 Transcript_14485/m.22016 type:complete len:204 (+) Transcript_14485:128-739(+)